MKKLGLILVSILCLLIPLLTVDAQNYYSSIATGKDNRGALLVTVSYDYQTDLDAKIAAFNSCQQGGGIYNTQIAIGVVNAACAVVTWGDSGFASGWGTNINTAIDSAKFNAVNYFKGIPGTPARVFWVKCANIRGPNEQPWGYYDDILPYWQRQVPSSGRTLNPTPNPNPTDPCAIYDRNDPLYAECELRLAGQ